MAIHSLGKVTVAASGTPQRLTANQSDPTARYACKSFLVQTWHDNTDLVYIGTSDIDRSTGVGVEAILPVPTSNTLPTFSATHDDAPAAFDLSQIWVDVDTSGEAVIVSAVR